MLKPSMRGFRICVDGNFTEMSGDNHGGIIIWFQHLDHLKKKLQECFQVKGDSMESWRGAVIQPEETGGSRFCLRFCLQRRRQTKTVHLLFSSIYLRGKVDERKRTKIRLKRAIRGLQNTHTRNDPSKIGILCRDLAHKKTFNVPVEAKSRVDLIWCIYWTFPTLAANNFSFKMILNNNWAFKSFKKKNASLHEKKNGGKMEKWLKKIFSSWTIGGDKRRETNLKHWWDHGDSRGVKWWQWMIQEIKMIPQIKNPACG